MPHEAQVAGLRLRFDRTRARGVVMVTDTERKGENGGPAWVATVYRIGARGGPCIRHNFAYRAQLGTGQFDHHGAAARQQICDQATDIN